MLSDSEKDEIIQEVKKAFPQLAQTDEIEFSEKPPTDIQENFVWKCLGTVKDLFVWVALSGKKCVRVCVSAIGVYGFFFLTTEVLCPGTLPSLQTVSNNLNEFLDRPISAEGHNTQSERYLVFNDEWQKFTTEKQLYDACDDIDFDDETQISKFTFLPEASGIIEKGIFDEGRELVGTASSELGLDDSVDIEVISLPPPPPIA